MGKKQFNTSFPNILNEMNKQEKKIQFFNSFNILCVIKPKLVGEM